MKNQTKILQCLFSVMVLVGAGYYPSFGQEKINVSTGIGLPELLNIGLRYQAGQLQLGGSVGTIPVADESLFSVSADVFYHFGGYSKLSERRPWYGRLGLSYLRDETESVVVKDVFINLRVGRDLNLSEKFGINIDAGLMAQLSHQKIRKKPSGGLFNLDFEYPVLPGIGLCLFFRI